MMAWRMMVLACCAGGLLLAGCNKDNSEPTGTGTGQSASSADQGAPAAASGEAPATPPATQDGSGAAQTGAATAAEEAQVPDPGMRWGIDGFVLGMKVDKARALLPDDPQHVRETWASENYTGMIVVGTYEESVGWMGSVVFFEGKLVAVIKNMREGQEQFDGRVENLRNTLGVPSPTTPEFAQGRQFIAAMLNDKRRPPVQYLWAEERNQTLFVAGYDPKQQLSTYMLINAAKYDSAAAELAAK